MRPAARTRGHYPEVGRPDGRALALLRVRQGGSAMRARFSQAGRSTRQRFTRSPSCGSPRASRSSRQACWSGRMTTCRATSSSRPVSSSRSSMPTSAARTWRRRHERAGRLTRDARSSPGARSCSGAQPSPAPGSHGHATTRAKRTSFAREALDVFSRLGMPHEAAEARVEVARAVAREQRALAIDEAKAALATFRDLGASRAQDSAAAFLRELGVGSPAGARGERDAHRRESGRSSPSSRRG